MTIRFELYRTPIEKPKSDEVAQLYKHVQELIKKVELLEIAVNHNTTIASDNFDALEEIINKQEQRLDKQNEVNQHLDERIDSMLNIIHLAIASDSKE